MYKMGKTTVAIAFSNPSLSRNKLGVGTHGKETWINMVDHGYKPFVEKLDVDDKQLYFVCECTGGEMNVAEVTIYVKQDKQEKPPKFAWANKVKWLACHVNQKLIINSTCNKIQGIHRFVT